MVDPDGLRAMLNQAVAAGLLPPDLLQKIDAAGSDPRVMDDVIKQLTAMMGDQAEPPLIIGDFYREGDGQKYTLRWPVSPGKPLPLPFDELDRKTQFFVLFTEWQRREAEGMYALTLGNLAVADAAFNECVERADQIDVGELRARSYEDLARVAETKGLPAEGIAFLQKAEAARQSGTSGA